MPEKEWEIHLPDGSRIIVRIDRNGQEVKGFSVVLVAMIDDSETCVTRYDTAHGHSHRDVIGRNGGLIEKQWLLSFNDKEAFEYAIKDLKENLKTTSTSLKTTEQPLIIRVPAWRDEEKLSVSDAEAILRDHGAKPLSKKLSAHYRDLLKQ